MPPMTSGHCSINPPASVTTSGHCSINPPASVTTSRYSSRNLRAPPRGSERPSRGSRGPPVSSARTSSNAAVAPRASAEHSSEGFHASAPSSQPSRLPRCAPTTRPEPSSNALPCTRSFEANPERSPRPARGIALAIGVLWYRCATRWPPPFACACSSPSAWYRRGRIASRKEAGARRLVHEFGARYPRQVWGLGRAE
jgi:hypothetical protein